MGFRQLSEAFSADRPHRYGKSEFLFSGKSFAGPVVPAAIRWLLNTIFMAVVSMLLTCFTAAMAGYALAKKRFIGRSVVFTPDRMCHGTSETGYLNPIAS